MKISLIPWEAIWLLIIAITILVGGASLLVWWRRGRLPRRWQVWLIGLVLSLALIPLGLRLLGYQFKFNHSTTVSTSLFHPSPDIRTHVYLKPHAEVYDAALEAVKSINTWGFPWTITWRRTDATGGVIKAEVHVLFLTDDLFVFVRQYPDGTYVNLHSQPQQPRQDLGENERHVVQFFRALEARLGPPANR